jgi:hypothetical protein
VLEGGCTASSMVSRNDRRWSGGAPANFVPTHQPLLPSHVASTDITKINASVISVAIDEVHFVGRQARLSRHRRLGVMSWHVGLCRVCRTRFLPVNSSLSLKSISYLLYVTSSSSPCLRLPMSEVVCWSRASPVLNKSLTSCTQGRRRRGARVGSQQHRSS